MEIEKEKKIEIGIQDKRWRGREKERVRLIHSILLPY